MGRRGRQGGGANLRGRLEWVLTQKAIIIPEALETHAIICYVYPAVCVPEKSYLESELCELDSFPITYVREVYILNMEQVIKN